ncbi:CRP-like cAMP-binding protein [Ulvibacter sp. MAR_2010_11]|uniref:Crp/Fnr family transcriptional regulator n=1 Tax=Ulvibacter sp. MAR_2010_11 TaxID=1250229 RepID=UPI000C2B7BB1|nr:Crp/Fnr family transcriptional regulator [Ulvibacter sp. MAR_2010_11]PKA84145.1 CRP-like cAMP-binding protein [Ulvibacter sp. MAR_2010_11]
METETMLFKNFRKYLKEKAAVEDAVFARLQAYLRAESFSKGSVLLKRGDICRDSIFVEKGLLRMYTLDEAGKEHIIQFAPENWFTGDRGSIYFNDPSYFIIEAIEDSEVLFVNDDFINNASELSPSYRKYNNKLLHNHIRQLQKRINLLLGASAEKRYLNFVKLYPDLLLRVPQWMIASYLGITPESLSRVRKELAHKNFKPY